MGLRSILFLMSPPSDWLWPAVWMLPVDSVYGAWPASGEIDVRPFFLYSVSSATITPLSDDSGDATHFYPYPLHLFTRPDNPFFPCTSPDHGGPGEQH